MPSPPITSDPPHHKPYKQLLLPSFTAEAMTGLEPKARAICNELIDKFIADGHCDAAQQYTRHIPVKVITHMLAMRQRAAALKKPPPEPPKPVYAPGSLEYERQQAEKGE